MIPPVVRPNAVKYNASMSRFIAAIGIALLVLALAGTFFFTTFFAWNLDRSFSEYGLLWNADRVQRPGRFGSGWGGFIRSEFELSSVATERWSFTLIPLALLSVQLVLFFKAFFCRPCLNWLVAMWIIYTFGLLLPHQIFGYFLLPSFVLTDKRIWGNLLSWVGGICLLYSLAIYLTRKWPWVEDSPT
jgi:hypothetical protein